MISIIIYGNIKLMHVMTGIMLQLHSRFDLGPKTWGY